MEATELTIEQKQILEHDINPIVKYAKETLIKTVDDSAKAQENIIEIKRRRKVVHEKFDPPVRAAHVAWKKAKDLYNFFVNPFDECETILKRKVITFEDNEQRKREEDQRIAEAKRLEAERKEREILDAKAKKAEEAGKPEKAEALREQSTEVAVQPTYVPPPPSGVKGTSFKSVWKAEVIDLKTLCRAIADSQASPNLVIPNQTALNQKAKSDRDTMPIAGVRFYEDKVMSSRV